MPVPVTQSRERQQPLDERILRLLQADPDNACTATEIVTALEGWDPKAAAVTIGMMTESEKDKLIGPHADAPGKVIDAERVQKWQHHGTSHYSVSSRK
jgi:hypothetical protein